MELNGFEILDYNVHGIPAKAKTATCPKCSYTRKKKNEKCMSVFWDTGLGQCNHCGERNIQLHTYRKKDEIKIYKKPESNTSVLISDHLVEWWNARGISESSLNKLKLTQRAKWMPKAQKEIQVMEFNYFLFGELVNIKSRGKNKDFMFESGCELIPFNMDAIIHENECVIVEGEPDVFSFYESGIENVCSVPNGFTLPREDGTSTINTSYLDSVYEFFESKEKIYLAVDNDEAGRHGQKELIRRFGSEKCYLVDFKDCKDANDYLLKYGKEDLANTIALAKQVPLEDVINLSDIEAELDDFWINGAPRGMTIDLKGFDDCASFVFKQHTLLVSAPGSGKSDFIDHILCRISLKYGHKVGICSTENLPLKFHYDKIFRKIYGVRPNAETLKNESVIDAKTFVKEHFYHIEKSGRYYLEDVLDKFAELAKRKGCRWFVLDPFNKITLKSFSKSDINAYTAEYHQLIDAFQQKYDCHVFLVVHPNKLPKIEGSDKTFVMPTAYDIKGGGEHYDMSYNIIGMVRNHERNLVQIRTLKWKFQHLGTMGVDNWYGWNINNGRYTEIENYYDETTTELPEIIWNNKNWLHEKLSFEEKMALKPEEPKQLPLMNPNDVFNQDQEDEVPF